MIWISTPRGFVIRISLNESRDISDLHGKQIFVLCENAFTFCDVTFTINIISQCEEAKRDKIEIEVDLRIKLIKKYILFDELYKKTVLSNGD
jgi:hypothetical protein